MMQNAAIVQVHSKYSMEQKCFSFSISAVNSHNFSMHEQFSELFTTIIKMVIMATTTTTTNLFIITV